MPVKSWLWRFCRDVRPAGFPKGAMLFFALAAFAVGTSTSRSADNPGELLKRNFDSAKAALATGDRSEAEHLYRQTVALGLRQIANLSLSESNVEEALHVLDEALKIAPGDPDLTVDAAIASFRAGDAKKARQIVQNVVAENPRNARAQNVLGRIDLFLGDFTASIRDLQASVAVENDFETGYFLGLAYLKAKQLPEAQRWYHQLQLAVGDSAALHVLFGRAYTIAHFPEPAVAEFRQAILLDPQYPRAHALLGYAYLESVGEESYPRAREEFERELKLHPGDYNALLLLGTATVALRDFPAAEAALLHAKRLRPDEAFAYLYLGEIYTQTNRPKQAVETLQKYINLVRVPEELQRDLSRAYFLLGQSLLKLNRVEEGKAALSRSQQYRESKFKYDAKHIFDEPEQKPSADDGDSRAPDRLASLLDAGASDENQGAQSLLKTGLPAKRQDTTPPESQAARQYRAFAAEILASSYNDLGVMRAQDSKYAEAAEYFKSAYSWNPHLEGVDRNWGLASYRADQFADALAPLDRQLAAHPNDSLVRQLLGLSYFMGENYPKTAEVLQPLLRNPPEDPGLLFAWGTALVRTRQPEPAKEIFTRLVEQNAANASVHFLFGQAYAQQKDYPNALSELKTASKLDPRLPEAHFYAGLAYLHQSQFEPAAQEFHAELALRPDDPATNYHLGFALLGLGQAADAAALFREVVKAKPDYESAYFELGRALLLQGDDAGAIDNLERAEKLAPDHEATYYQLSQAYRRAGRTQEAQQAIATYQRLIEGNRQKKRESLEIEKP
jgi:tetratricopeptide (TPR) repeat protein